MLEKSSRNCEGDEEELIMSLGGMEQNKPELDRLGWKRRSHVSERGGDADAQTTTDKASDSFFEQIKPRNRW